MARSRRMRRWWAENRPLPPAALADEQAELADVDALWRWTRALLRDGLGQRHRPAPEPQLSAQLLENWRECMHDLADVAGLDGSLHPLDVDAAAGYVRQRLRHELGHRPRQPRRPVAVTDLQDDVLVGLARAAVLELAQRYPARREGRELLAVSTARAQHELSAGLRG